MISTGDLVCLDRPTAMESSAPPPPPRPHALSLVHLERDSPVCKCLKLLLLPNSSCWRFCFHLPVVVFVSVGSDRATEQKKASYFSKEDERERTDEKTVRDGLGFPRFSFFLSFSLSPDCPFAREEEKMPAHSSFPPLFKVFGIFFYFSTLNFQVKTLTRQRAAFVNVDFADPFSPLLQK